VTVRVLTEILQIIVAMIALLETVIVVRQTVLNNVLVIVPVIVIVIVQDKQHVNAIVNAIVIVVMRDLIVIVRYQGLNVHFVLWTIVIEIVVKTAIVLVIVRVSGGNNE
jgi:hypothetical protein